MPITDTDFNKKNLTFREQELNELLKKIQKSESTGNRGLAAAILAAGLGKRMKSPEKPKVMFEINSRPMIDYVVELALGVNADKIVPIVGHHRELVIEFLDNKYPDGNIEYAVQGEQLGTGHAVMQTENMLGDFEGDILILSGDVPLLKLETVKKLINEHTEKDNNATLLTTVFRNAAGYGRIVRDENGKFLRIVEDKDASENEKLIKEINPAIYIVKRNVLFDALDRISPDNSQGEYYLTDIFHFISKERTGTVVTGDELEVTGVNSIEQLKEMESALNSGT